MAPSRSCSSAGPAPDPARPHCGRIYLQRLVKSASAPRHPPAPRAAPRPPYAAEFLDSMNAPGEIVIARHNPPASPAPDRARQKRGRNFPIQPMTRLKSCPARHSPPPAAGPAPDCWTSSNWSDPARSPANNPQSRPPGPPALPAPIRAGRTPPGCPVQLHRPVQAATAPPIILPLEIQPAAL